LALPVAQKFELLVRADFHEGFRQQEIRLWRAVMPEPGRDLAAGFVKLAHRDLYPLSCAYSPLSSSPRRRGPITPVSIASPSASHKGMTIAIRHLIPAAAYGSPPSRGRLPIVLRPHPSRLALLTERCHAFLAVGRLEHPPAPFLH